MHRRYAMALTLLACTLAVRTATADPAQGYSLHCMGCHGSKARGVPGRVPPLAGTLVRFMQSTAGRNYVLRVPGAANSALDDAQLADVLNWITVKFPGTVPDAPVTPFNAVEVAAARHLPLASVQAARRAAVEDLAASGVELASQY